MVGAFACENATCNCIDEIQVIRSDWLHAYAYAASEFGAKGSAAGRE